MICWTENQRDPLKLANNFNNFYVEKIRKLRKTIPTEHDSGVDIEDF